MTQFRSLPDAFCHELQDIYAAERQLIATLPGMVDRAYCEKLALVLRDYLKQSKTQVARIIQSLDDTGTSPDCTPCHALKSLFTEIDSMLPENGDPDVADAILISLTQKVQHYIISGHSTLCIWASQLSYVKAQELLKLNLDEAGIIDQLLASMGASVSEAAV